MMRVAAAVLLAILAALPVRLVPAPPVTWLAAGALAVGGAGVLTLLVPLVTAGASLALVAYAVALLIAPRPADPLAASGLGATLVVLLALVHFAARVRGAALGPSVVASQLRQWLGVAAVGVLVAVALTAGASALRAALRPGVALPVVVVAAALGALMAVAGVIALMTSGGNPSAPLGR